MTLKELKTLVVNSVLIMLSFQVASQDSSSRLDGSHPYLVICQDSLYKKECSDQYFVKYITENLVQPEISIEQKSEGTLLFEFDINENGLIENEKVIHAFDEYIKKAGESFLAKMKNELKWIPGQRRGENKSVSYQLPVVFEHLEDSIRQLKSIENLICERGSTFMAFEVDKNDFLKMIKNKTNFKDYWIYKMGKRNFVALDIQFNFKENSEYIGGLKKFTNKIHRRVLNCKSGDRIMIRLQENFNGYYDETVKVVNIK